MVEKDDKKKNSEVVLGIELPWTERFSTGLLSFDEILGGGLVIGSIVEIFGEESDGKTTLGLHILSEGQKRGFEVLYIDAEHSTTKEYLEKLVDLKTCYYSRPASGEEAFDALRDFWGKRKSKYNMVLIDSVPALISEKQVETGDAAYGPVAKLLSQNLPSVLRGYKNSVVIFINQVRDKIGSWGGGVDTTGGWALKFYAGHRVKVDTIKMIMNDEKKLVGKTVKLEVVKNKFGRPFDTCYLDLVFGEGFSRASDLFEYAMRKGIIERGGAWFSFKGERLGQGKENCIQMISKVDGLFEKIEKECLGGKKDGEHGKTAIY